MKNWSALLVVGALGAASLWAAQQPASPEAEKAAKKDEMPTIRVDVTRVNFQFSVTDKKGRFVTDLGKDDFEVVDGKRPQNIMEFAAESNLPLRMGILIDTSNSVRERFRFEQEAATEFVDSIINPNADKALVISFDTQTQLASDLSGNLREISSAIARLHPGGGTALYDAIFYACRDKLGLDRPLYSFRRAIVLLSDGDDNQSIHTRDQALEMAIENQVVVYAISTNVSKGETDGDKVLKYLAEETGGMAYFPFKVEDMAQNFANIANELRHQYNISYRPEPLVLDGLFHPISVRVKGRKDLTVRVARGYIASKPEDAEAPDGKNPAPAAKRPIGVRAPKPESGTRK
jgi:Ca-activated chloride channel homolog